jgi:hypothetical protein
MPYRYNIEIDFIRDFTNILKDRLIEMGYSKIKHKSDYDICRAYFNLERRLIIPKPRHIKISQELNCPKHLEEEFELLKRKIKNGEDLTLHLSKEIFNLDYNDDMLNDWGIYHLHMGKDIDKKKGYIKRTNELLFARFDNENAYLIDILGHGSWTRLDLIRIIHDNWEDSIKQFRLNEVLRTEPSISDGDVKKLRKVHAFTFIEVREGVVYMPLGMGYASSGDSIEVIRKCDCIFNSLKAHENNIKNNINGIVENIEKSDNKIGSKLWFRLNIENNKVYALEVYSKIALELQVL